MNIALGSLICFPLFKFPAVLRSHIEMATSMPLFHAATRIFPLHIAFARVVFSPTLSIPPLR